ncbi:MAG: hypothetical protein COA79_19900 [Planctomycetota bacterium]|nr:MAG: hypothetical protein COA79_19900 [Planctomycetota bacterium]
MNFKYIMMILIISIFALPVFSDDNVEDIIQQKKPVKDYTEKELIYIASFLFGFQMAESISRDPKVKVNFDKLVEGFENKLKDKKLEINAKEVAEVRAALKLVATEKKSPSKDIVDKLSYMNGIDNGKQFSSSPLLLNKDTFILGIKYVKNKKEFKIEEEVKKAIYGRMRLAYQEANSKKEKGFFDVNGKKEGVVSLKNGLQYKVLKKGKGELFSKGQNADVHYEGRLINGTVFDSSYKRGQTFNVKYKGQVIKGWQEILALMKEGDQWEVYIPSEMAYGSRGSPPTIKPNAILIFKMEIIKINK